MTKRTLQGRSPSGNTELKEIVIALHHLVHEVQEEQTRYLDMLSQGDTLIKVPIDGRIKRILSLIDQTATNRCIEELEGCEESLLDISADHLGYINNRIAELKGKP